MVAGDVQAWKNTGKWFDIDGDGVRDVHALSKYSRPSLLNKVVTDMVYVSPKAPQALTKLRFDWKIGNGHRFAGTLPRCWSRSGTVTCYWKLQNRWSTIHSTPHKDFQIELDPTITPAIGKITASAPAHEPLPAWKPLKKLKDLIPFASSVGGAVVVADARPQEASGDADTAQASSSTDWEDTDEDAEPSELAGDQDEAWDDSEAEYDEDESDEFASEYGDEGEGDYEIEGDEASEEVPDTSDEIVWLDLKSHVSTEDGETYEYRLTAENNTDATIRISLVTFVNDLESTLDTKEYTAEPGESVLEELTSDQYPFEVRGSATAEIEGEEVEFFAPVFVPFREEFEQYDIPEEAPAEDAGE
jgi:hypothetical protein